MEAVRGHQKNFHQYWHLLERSAGLSHQLRSFLNDQELQLKIIDQYMGGGSPIWKEKNTAGLSRAQLGTSYHSKLKEMMDTLAHLVRACHTIPTSQNPNCPPPPTSYPGCPLLVDQSKARYYIFYNVCPFLKLSNRDDRKSNFHHSIRFLRPQIPLSVIASSLLIIVGKISRPPRPLWPKFRKFVRKRITPNVKVS